MSFFNRYGYGSQSYAPSAPSLPGVSQEAYHHQSSSSSSGYNYFPPGTSPEVIRSFGMVDRDRSGFIDDMELRQALSTAYNMSFSLRTIRLLIFLFNSNHSPLRIGPKEFAALWSCLGQWRGTFDRYDRDRSGRIDALELRDALYGLGYAVPSSVLQLLISKYDNGGGLSRIELDFDSFVECGMIVKGLTEKFKAKDSRYTGSATFNYEEFMSMVIPFLVSY